MNLKTQGTLTTVRGAVTETLITSRFLLGSEQAMTAFIFFSLPFCDFCYSVISLTRKISNIDTV